MAKFNEKKTKRLPTETNKMGEAAYKLDAKEELVATVLTTFVQKSYYESENEIVNRIKKSALECDPLFVAKTAVYARTQANMRSVSHLLAAELSPRITGAEWASRFYEKIVVRPDDMSEIVSYYKNVMKQKAFSNAIKKGFKKKLEKMDAYLIDKYKMFSRSITLIDLVNLFHPKPTQKNDEAFRLLMTANGKGIDKLYESKILEKEMSKAGVSLNKPVTEAKKEAIESVLGNVKGMPIFNLLRNLRNIVLYAPDSVDEAIKQLTNPAAIEKSRLLPFRFLSAYKEIDDLTLAGKKAKGVIIFEDEQIETKSITSDQLGEIKKKILAAIEKAIELSCANIPELEGRTAVLIDHSGSMRGDGGGTSLVSAFSHTRSSDIANVFASMLIHKQPSVYVGLFGDNLINFEVDRSENILKSAQRMHREGNRCGGATEHGIYLFFEALIREKKRVDNIIIFSDQVIGNGNSWYGSGRVSSYSTYSGTFQKLFSDFRKLFPYTKVISVDIRQTDGTTVFNKNLNVTQVAGWSEKIFDVISSGTAGYKAIIEEIEKIVI